jgi:hypothetical protein
MVAVFFLFFFTEVHFLNLTEEVAVVLDEPLYQPARSAELPYTPTGPPVYTGWNRLCPSYVAWRAGMAELSKVQGSSKIPSLGFLN